jgi:hypothetical protein
MQPTRNIDIQYLDVNEPNTRMATSLERSDLFDGIVAVTREGVSQSEAHYSNSSSLEPWIGLGCTCGLSFIPCNEHGNLSGTDFSNLLPHVTANQYHYSHAANGLQADIAERSIYHTDALQADPQPINSNTTGEQQATSKLKRARVSPFSDKITRTLDEHFASDPYPKRRDIEGLAIRTGLRAKSIMTWFTNARARKRIKWCELAPVP